MIPPLKLDDEGFLALGREDVTNKKQGFSMAVLAIRLADHINGVSARCTATSAARCGTTSGRRCPPDEVPIRHITNGIHVRTWLSPDIQFTLDRYLRRGVDEQPGRPERLGRTSTQIPDEELWRAHERCRERLVGWARHTLREQLTKRGAQLRRPERGRARCSIPRR